MHRYAVYGATLESAIAFPDLPPAAPEDAPRWTFTVTAALPPMAESVLQGEDLIYGTCRARLLAHAAGHRITVDDTGAFDLAVDRRAVTGAPLPQAHADFVRAHLVGRVLATALYLDGWMTLHGSAVETREGTIAFLAPKGSGKSSLAATLVGLGARLVTDDTLPVAPGPEVRALPGVHALRLHDDALALVRGPRETHPTHERKRIVAGFGAAERSTHETRLAALYLLDGGGATLERQRLLPVHAAAALVGHVKVGRMLGSAAAREMLARAAAIVAQVPVRRLAIPRDLAALPGHAATVLDWHGGAP